MLDFNNEKEKQYYSEKFNSNNILKDIENIEKIEKNDDIMQPYLIKTHQKITITTLKECILILTKFNV